ncbi:hypothetical protein B9Q00_01995 [Candidatus Marsarchaeota G1 archaeon OSP_C]|uniref:UDP-N-acetyl-D-mannosamine dehydrogenase n=1 Tax=Candidatus Marsarchaeota G1 archaeon OSP_C TaxID=1978154 RepID=A0A2R6ASI8_9ARCH|nr:MAG: hypothetical protein B9Q00_01995 [Candidatus Marsarchaeota G1 archaeon OSP_C]
MDSVAVYGVGRVGLVLAAAWCKAGYNVVGVDVNSELVERLNSLNLEFVEEQILREVVKEGLKAKTLTFTTDGLSASKNATIHLIAVPTPIDWQSKKFDSSFLDSAVETISTGLKKGDTVILESSVPPGTTKNSVKPRLERKSGLVAEEDFYLAFSPERVYVGRAYEDLVKRYPKIVGGVGPKSTERVATLYSKIAEKGVIRVRDSTTAETTKLFEGIYRDVNIALANELALFCQTLGVNYYEIQKAANTQPYCHLHSPGPGVGGMCIPLYPYFVLEAAKEIGVQLPLVSLTRSINESMPSVTADFVLSYARSLELRELKLAILGAAYRGNISDSRNSPAVELAITLKKKGFENIRVHDPFVFSDRKLKQFGIELTRDLKRALKDANVVVVAVDHAEYSLLTLKEIKRLSGAPKTLVVDTKGILKAENVDGVFFAALGVGKTSS